MSEKILLVEGGSDSSFFASLTKKIGINNLSIKPPVGFNQPSNGIDNVIGSLPLVLRQTRDGSISKVGIVVDADYTVNGSGPENRYNQVTKELKKYSYKIPEYSPKIDGFIFSGEEGMPNIGLWIMPNNEHEGMLENLILSSITNADQKKLLCHAKNSVQAIPVILFNTAIHSQKVLTNTLLSWQKDPGCGFSYLVRESLIDINCEEINNLRSWLSRVFN